MKVRQGFVSNSSSSSFVVAVNKGKKPKFTMDISVDLSLYAEELRTLEDLECYYLDTVGYTEKELIEHEYLEELDTYRKAKRAIKAGKTVLVGSFTNDSEDPLEQFLCEEGIKSKRGVFTVLDNDPGF